MDILRILAIALLGTVMAIYLKEYNKSFAFLVSLAAGCIIAAMMFPYFSDFIAGFKSIADSANLSGMGLVIKVLGIAFIVKYGGELCRDAGEGALAAKLEMGGKIILLSLALPVIKSLFETVVSIIP